jgi:hypothetical protein
MANVKWVAVARPQTKLPLRAGVTCWWMQTSPSAYSREDISNFLGVSEMPCRVMVPETPLGESQAILNENREGQEMGNDWLDE